jgi:hypothetical protein
MATVKPILVKDFSGGENDGDPTTIEDNQLASAKNCFYDTDKILTTRRGSKSFGDALSDTVVLLNTCDAATNFVGTNDATTVATGAAIRGAFSVSFNIDVSADAGNDFAPLTNAALGTVDCSAANGKFGFWLFVPTAFNTELTAVTIRLGSDSTNYHEWTLGTLTENANNFIKLAFADATDTGTPDDSSVDYFRLLVTYTASYTDKTPILIDAMYCYSSTETKPVHSFGTDQTGHSFETTAGVKHLLAGCGTNIFEYRETENVWEVINTGLTDGTKFDAKMFKDVVYLTNGTDNYRDYNGTLITEYGGVEKGKFLIVANDVAFMGGVATDPSTIFYTAANPTNLQAYANNETVDEDNGQVLTGLTNIGALIIAFKERSSYIFNVATPSIDQTDYDGGCKSHRTISRVENDMYFLSDSGVFSMAQREGTSGTTRGLPLSRNIRKAMNAVKDKTIAASIYWPATNNYYLAVDDSGASQNRTIRVYSILTKGWTHYKGINANDFVIYTDSSNVEHLLAANAYGGQVIEMESGFTDSDNVIDYEIITKTYDFGLAGRNMVYQRVDVGGFHSEQNSMNAKLEITNINAAVKQKVIAYNAATESPAGTGLATLGAKPLASTPLGGAAPRGSGGGDDLTMYAFFRMMPTYLTGRNARLTFSKAQKDAAFKLTKINLYPVAQPKDFAPNALFI